jgi:hypothetical protein
VFVQPLYEGVVERFFVDEMLCHEEVDEGS